MEEYGTGTVGMTEGARGIKRECTVFVHARSAKRIIGTLDVAIEKESAFGATKLHVLSRLMKRTFRQKTRSLLQMASCACTMARLVFYGSVRGGKGKERSMLQ